MNKKRAYYVLFFLFAFSGSWSQQNIIDSLIKLSDTSNLHDTAKIKLYGDISWELMSSNINQSLKYAQLELALSVKHNRKADIAQAQSDIGNVYNRKADYDSALVHYFKAIKLREELKQEVKVAGIYNNVATVYMRQNKFKEALDINFKSLKIFEQINDEVKQAIILGNIGNLYYELEQNAAALEFFNKSLQLAEKNNHLITKANVLINIGGILYEEGISGNTITNKPKVDSALADFLVAEIIFNQLNAAYNLGAVYNNIGRIYMMNRDYNSALSYYEKSLKNRMEVDDVFGIGLCHLNISDILYKQQSYDKALNHLEKSADIFLKAKNFVFLKDAYGKMAECYEAKGNYPACLKYYQLYGNYKDSVYNQDNIDKMAEMRTKYETEKKENEIKDLKQQQEINTLQLQKRNYLLIALTLLVLLISAVSMFYVRYQRHQRKLAVQQTEEKERQRMAKDIHDDLGSGLSKIKFMSEVISSKSKNNPEILSSVKSISETSIRLVDNMRDLIWALNPDNTQLDSLVARIREYSNDYLSDTDKKLVLDVSEHIPAQKINSQAHRNILFIAKEALQNIVKHANAAEVRITITTGNESLHLHIADNGTGISGNHSGNGLHNMKQRASSIGATLHINSNEKGTEIQLRAPLSNLLA